jgi:hypothetical protein
MNVEQSQQIPTQTIYDNIGGMDFVDPLSQAIQDITNNISFDKGMQLVVRDKNNKLLYTIRMEEVK